MADAQRSSLTVVGGPLAGRSYVLPDGVGQGTIGSHPGCNIPIPLPGVDERHALLHCRVEGVYAADVGSARGLFVNETRVVGQQRLDHGDILWLGPPNQGESVGFRCYLASAAQPAPPPPPPVESDDFFVTDTPVLASSAVTEAVEDAFFADSAMPAAATPPQEASAAFFVGDLPPSALPSSPSEASAAFFVADLEPPASPPTPSEASGGFFVADSGAVPAGEAVPPAGAAELGEAVFVAHGPSASAPAEPASVEEFLVDDVPGLVAQTATVALPPPAAAPLPAPKPAPVPAAAPRTASAPPTSPQVSKGTQPPAVSARPAGASRPVVVPAPSPGKRTPLAGGSTRPQSTSPLRTAAPRSAGPARRPARPSRGLPGWIWPVVAISLLLIAAGGGYAVLMLVGRPKVASIEPGQARIGDIVTLSGEGLVGAAGEARVWVDGQPAEIVKASATRVEVRVPALAIASGEQKDVVLQVGVGRKRSVALALRVREVPRIRGIAPDVALPGEEILVGGGGWAATGVQVTFDGTPGQVIEATPTFVRARVPGLTAPFGTIVRVTVTSGQDASEPAALILGRLPVVTAVEPSAASMGGLVTLRGRGLRASPADHSASIGGAAALVVGAAEGTLTLLVPALAVAGEAVVEVRVRGYAQSAVANLMVNAAPEPIDLRFTAEPLVDAAGTRAAVGTRLGPAFVFAPSGGKSAAERAGEAVRRLNAAAVVLRERGESAVELRRGPASAFVLLAGATEPLLEVTNEDALGYSGAIAPRSRTAAITRGRVAHWWAAQLKDLAMILARNERPRNAAGLAAEGRVLGDLYDAAARGGAGVTGSVLSGLRPAARDGLRALGLRVPATVPEPPA